jgi:hypothetical protein
MRGRSSIKVIVAAEAAEDGANPRRRRRSPDDDRLRDRLRVDRFVARDDRLRSSSMPGTLRGCDPVATMISFSP